MERAGPARSQGVMAKNWDDGQACLLTVSAQVAVGQTYLIGERPPKTSCRACRSVAWLGRYVGDGLMEESECSGPGTLTGWAAWPRPGGHRALCDGLTAWVVPVSCLFGFGRQ